MAGGLGGLLTTEVVTTELGTHGGRRLRARVQRRALRVALGSRLRASLVRLRPLAVEQLEAGGSAGAHVVAITVPPDPLLQALQRTIVLWVASMVLRRVVSRLRASVGREAMH